MKNLLYLCVCSMLSLFSCQPKESAPEDRSIGFATAEPSDKWHLGTEAAIQVVKDLDAVWSKKDFDGMRVFFSDTASFYFPNGTVVKSPEEFIAILKKSNEEVEDSWTFDYAFSVDLNPSLGGEHVQAGFTNTSVKAGVTTKRNLHESYYIINGKIVWWNQYAMDLKE